MESQPTKALSGWILAGALFCLSMALVSLELTLMRYLSFVSYHHFSFLVISTALMGFGISGSLLSLFGDKLRARFGLSCAVFSAFFSLSVILSVNIAQALPVNFQYALYDLRQALILILYHLVFLLPFLFGAFVIGLSLSHFTEKAGFLYGASMCGSGTGAVLAVAGMFILPDSRLFYLIAVLGLAASASFVGFSFWARKTAPQTPNDTKNERKPTNSGRIRLAPGVFITLAAASLLCIMAYFFPFDMIVDEHKLLHQILHWEQQGQAKHLLTRHSPRGRIDVYSSPLLRNTPFVGPSAWTDGVTPPRQLALLRDGEALGTVYEIDDAKEAAVMDHTIMSFPYRVKDSPRVLLLGETGGINVWLAKRMDASDIKVVQEDPAIFKMMKGPLAERAGHVFSLENVTPYTMSPRLYLERADNEDFDIIQMVAAEGVAAAHGGLGALKEDFLMTKEAFQLCLENLSETGILALSRGIQTPPRDNIKILATAAEALGDMGFPHPERHVLQMHNYLGVITLISPTTFTHERSKRIAEVAAALQLDIDWSASEKLPISNRRARLPGPDDSDYSYYHYAASQIFSPRAEQFFDEWIYNVEPARDGSPYFHNFFRWRSLPVLRDVYGADWLRRSEFGYVVVVAALTEVVVIGAVLIFLPLLWLRRKQAKRNSAPGRKHLKFYTILYFLALGFAFMMTEMMFIVRLTHFLGSPVVSAGGVLCAFLVFSGLGSATSERFFRRYTSAICFAVAGIIIWGLFLLVSVDSLIKFGAGWSMPFRLAAAIGILAPMAYLMGMPFPNGLRLFGSLSPPLVPWAWGINGFASVAAAPLGLLLGMEFGFSRVILLGLLLYASAAVSAIRTARIFPFEMKEDKPL